MDVMICFKVSFIVFLIDKYAPYFMYRYLRFELQIKILEKLSSNRVIKNCRSKSKASTVCLGVFIPLENL